MKAYRRRKTDERIGAAAARRAADESEHQRVWIKLITDTITPTATSPRDRTSRTRWEAENLYRALMELNRLNGLPFEQMELW